MMVSFVGITGIVFTVMLHAVSISALIHGLQRYAAKDESRVGVSDRTFLLTVSACLLAVKHGIDIVLWGLIYWYFVGEQFPTIDDAIYFSSVTYTTLGYGDIVVQGPWRLLCTFEAISGMILFGLSTALLFTLVSRLWLQPLQEKS